MQLPKNSGVAQKDTTCHVSYIMSS